MSDSEEKWNDFRRRHPEITDDVLEVTQRVLQAALDAVADAGECGVIETAIYSALGVFFKKADAQKQAVDAMVAKGKLRRVGKQLFLGDNWRKPDDTPPDAN